MSLIDIKYIFSAGFRCYSSGALTDFGLRAFSGPFDSMFIDIETVFELVHEKLERFLTNVIVYNNRKQQRYANAILNELNNKYVYYMGEDYTNTDLRINTNFMDDVLLPNLYDWKRICIHHHHDIFDKEQYAIVSRRVERFNKIITDQSEKTCLFHITRILTINNINEYMDNILRLKLLYSINTYIIIIVCCDNLENAHYFKESCLFVIKKVDSYDIQINQRRVDNELDYTNEFNIIKQVFNFQLVALSDL